MFGNQTVTGSARSIVATFSIAAADPAEREVGVAVASRFLAVGSVVPWVRAEVGAVATQAMANLDYGPRGLGLLAQGIDPADLLDEMTGADAERDNRQVGIVSADGRCATYTGPSCLPWAGGRTGAGYACQGNILAGPQVVDAMAAAFEAASGRLAERLMAALQAGDVAGGDRRGRQSAALYVARPGAGFLGMNDRFIDLRVDDHASPVAELMRLTALHRDTWGDTGRPAGLDLTPDLAQEIATRLGRILGTAVEADGASIAMALGVWAPRVQASSRLRADGRIDPILLDILRTRSEA